MHDEPSDDSGSSPEKKHVLKRDLPKPVTYGFFGLLALIVVFQLGRYLIKQQDEKAEQEQKAVEDYRRQVERAENRAIRDKVEQRQVRVRENLEGGGYYFRNAVSDPVLDEPDLDGLDVNTLKLYFKADPTLASRSNDAGLTFAHVAVMFGRDDLLQCLIDHQGFLLGKTRAGVQPLHIAAMTWPKSEQRDGLLACAALLLKAGAYPNDVAEGIGSATDLSANHTDTRLLKLLIQHGGRSGSGPLRDSTD